MTPSTEDHGWLLDPPDIDADEDIGGRVARERALLCVAVIGILLGLGWPVGSWVHELLTTVAAVLQQVVR